MNAYDIVCVSNENSQSLKNWKDAISYRQITFTLTHNNLSLIGTQFLESNDNITGNMNVYSEAESSIMSRTIAVTGARSY